MSPIIRTALLAGFLASVAAPLAAQTPAPPDTTHQTRAQLAASVNNAGLQQSIEWSASRRLTHSTNPWLADAHVAAGGSLALPPASARAGLWAEVAPLSVLVIRAGVDPSHYFGTFDSVTSFDRREAAFDDDARKAAGNARAGQTVKFFVSPTLQARVGHIAGQVSADFERWSSSADGPYFYEPTRDTLLAVRGDRLATISSVVLREWTLDGGGMLSVGPMHSLMRVGSGSFNQIQKAGVVASLQTAGRHAGLLAPKATVVIARYLDDPNKKGQWSAAVAISIVR